MNGIGIKFLFTQYPHIIHLHLFYNEVVCYIYFSVLLILSQSVSSFSISLSSLINFEYIMFSTNN